MASKKMYELGPISWGTVLKAQKIARQIDRVSRTPITSPDIEAEIETALESAMNAMQELIATTLLSVNPQAWVPNAPQGVNFASADDLQYLEYGIMQSIINEFLARDDSAAKSAKN